MGEKGTNNSCLVWKVRQLNAESAQHEGSQNGISRLNTYLNTEQCQTNLTDWHNIFLPYIFSYLVYFLRHSVLLCNYPVCTPSYLNVAVPTMLPYKLCGSKTMFKPKNDKNNWRSVRDSNPPSMRDRHLSAPANLQTICYICNICNFGGAGRTRTYTFLRPRQTHYAIMLQPHYWVGKGGVEPPLPTYKAWYATVTPLALFRWPLYSFAIRETHVRYPLYMFAICEHVQYNEHLFDILNSWRREQELNLLRRFCRPPPIQSAIPSMRLFTLVILFTWLIWWTGGDSNTHHSACKADVLPL